MGIRTSNFDAILAGTPSDATAARVVGRGTHYTPAVEYDPGTGHSRDPLPVVDPRDLNDQQAEMVRPLIGQRAGRFKIIGYAREQSPQGGSGSPRLVMRCACGAYEYVRSNTARKAIRNGTDLHCSDCEHIQHINYVYRAEGAAPIRELGRPAPKPQQPAALKKPSGGGFLLGDIARFKSG